MKLDRKQLGYLINAHAERIKISDLAAVNPEQTAEHIAYHTAEIIKLTREWNQRAKAEMAEKKEAA